MTPSLNSTSMSPGSICGARLVVLRHGQDAQDHAAAREQLEAAVGAHQQRRIVAGVGEHQLAGGRVRSRS